jgi:hypothetical protein
MIMKMKTHNLGIGRAKEETLAKGSYMRTRIQQAKEATSSDGKSRMEEFKREV